MVILLFLFCKQKENQTDPLVLCVYVVYQWLDDLKMRCFVSLYIKHASLKSFVF